MTGPNFSEILNQSMDDFAPPVPFPAGSYVCMIEGLPEFDKSTKKATPFVRFTLRPVEAMDDVDPGELDAFGPLGDKRVKDTYYLTEDAKYRLKKFISDCGVDPTGKTPGEAINELPGQSVIVHIKHRQSETDERIFAEVTGTSAVK